MINVLDIVDRDLRFKTKNYNKALEHHFMTYGKRCTYYLIPNKEGKENDTTTEYSQNEDVNNPIDNYIRTDNYVLALGQNRVGFDYSKLNKKNGYIFADLSDYYKHTVGSDDTLSAYLYIYNISVARGDIISWDILDRTVFYRISDIALSFQNIAYRLNLKLVQSKFLEKSTEFEDLDEQTARFSIPAKNGVVL